MFLSPEPVTVLGKVWDFAWPGLGHTSILSTEVESTRSEPQAEPGEGIGFPEELGTITEERGGVLEDVDCNAYSLPSVFFSLPVWDMQLPILFKVLPPFTSSLKPPLIAPALPAFFPPRAPRRLIFLSCLVRVSE